MLIKCFNNGNFNVKHDPEYDYNDNLIEQLCCSAELDFCTASEYWSLGNYGMAMDLFNYKTGLTYIVTESDVEQFKRGRTIKLIGFNRRD